MKLAFFSPFSPQQSGIADYSEELLPHLAQGAEIDLFVEGFQSTNQDISTRFRAFDYVRDPAALARLDDYDAVLYHLGNDHRYHAGIYDVARQQRGIIVFHDFALQDFFLGLSRARGRKDIYLDEVEACDGRGARLEAEEALARGGVPSQVATPLAFPLNQRLARTAEAIIVHSEWSRQRFSQIAPATPIVHINHHITSSAAESLPPANHEHHAVLSIASFGLITPDKGLERALRALAALRHEHAFHYTLVGAPNSFFDIHELVKRYGLTERVTITDHVSLEEFQKRMMTTGLAINLRERTAGETSGSLCRLMAAGVPAVVSNHGWFAELPDDAVVKIEMDEYADALLQAYLKRLIEDAPLRRRIGENARRYVLAAHHIERSAANYLSFIREVIASRARRRFINGVATEISRLGATPTEDEHLLRRVAQEVAALAPAHLFDSSVAAPIEARHVGPSLAAHHQADENGGRSVHAATPEVNPAADAHESTRIAAPPSAASSNGRLPKIEGIDYKRAAVEYPRKLDAERYHYLLTKPFYNLAHKPPKHAGDGLDEETHRHFADFINMGVALALPAGQRILDAGCGSGWLSEYFARLGYDVTGIDISPDLIHIAQERVARVPYEVDHEIPLRCRFIAHDIESAPLDEEFDAVVCYDSLHHFVDERAVMRHLAAMTKRGGLLFILEGDKPPAGSATEEELVDVMRRYETLESPFSRDYLRTLLVEHGFAVVGDYVSVNGLFARDMLEDDKLRVTVPDINYLLCKKVVEEGSAASVPDSRQPGLLAAKINLAGTFPATLTTGAPMSVSLIIENTGDTLWLTGPATSRGSVMLAVKLLDEQGRVCRERHGIPKLPRAVAPGESVPVTLEETAPLTPGQYRLKIDMVAQHVSWFEQQGSEPLVRPFQVCSEKV